MDEQRQGLAGLARLVPPCNELAAIGGVVVTRTRGMETRPEGGSGPAGEGAGRPPATAS